MSTEPDHLLAGIAALESQRARLGDRLPRLHACLAEPDGAGEPRDGGARRARRPRRLIGRIQQALGDYRADPGKLEALRAAVDAYADFQWAHMSKEAQEILPLAETALQPEDWAPIAAAFKSNDDPMVGVDRQKEFRGLFGTVVNPMPAPMGLGPERR